MNTRTFRNTAFHLHRWIGLVIGLVAIIVGLTGSLLVFHSEISAFDQQRRIGTITPQGDPLPLEVVIDNVKQSFANQPNPKVQSLSLPKQPTKPIDVWVTTKEDEWTRSYVNPYTGIVLNANLKPSLIEKVFEVVYPLHYALLGGDWGYKFVGIIGLLMTFLAITGIILWPGWRKLINGFKIKWNAHPKRVNFDVHKVAGVITAVFLILTFLTGFFWNFGEFVNPVIYAATFSKSLEAPVSVLVKGKAPVALSDQLKTAQAALPNGALRRVNFPNKPEEALSVSFKLPQEIVDYGQSTVYLDQFSGKVLRVDSSLQMSLGDKILNSFTPLHYGTFGGLLTRIFYIFVGLAPLILFITGFVMWRYRRQAKPSTNAASLETIQAGSRQDS